MVGVGGTWRSMPDIIIWTVNGHPHMSLLHMCTPHRNAHTCREKNKIYSLHQNHHKRGASCCSTERTQDLQSYIKVIVVFALLSWAFTQMGWEIAVLAIRISDTTAVIEYLRDRFEKLQNMLAKCETALNMSHYIFKSFFHSWNSVYSFKTSKT